MAGSLERLKQRKLVQWALAYIAAAFALLQVMDIVAQQFGWPDVVRRGMTLALVVGFFVMLVLAWYHGEKGAQRVTTTELLILILLLAFGGGFLWRFVGIAPTQTDKAAVGPNAFEMDPIAIPDKSIAVLPFQNLSSDKENAYFTEGIQDEILTRLSKIAALKVISRTSSQKYQSAPNNLRQVGRELGVAHLLEGSVQKVANAVLINVQLIRAGTDEHVWAESYTRKLDDIFAVEGEVASAIANQLNAKLTGAERKALSDQPTQNPAAYDAYLKGATIEQNQYGFDAYSEAARNYTEAIRLDPMFALAWARLSVIRSFLYSNAVDQKTNSAQSVREAADRSLALAPDAGESWIAQGVYRYRVLRDFEAAVDAYKQAQTRLPNSSYLFENLGFVLRRLGRWEESEINFKKALELDPRDVLLLTILGGEFYSDLRRFDDAKIMLDRALAISPSSESARAYKAGVLQSEGRLEEAAQELSRIPEGSEDDFVLTARIDQEIYQRHFEAVIRRVEPKLISIQEGESLNGNTQVVLIQLGFCQKWTGRDAESAQTFSKVVQAIKSTPEANSVTTTLALAYAGLGEKEKALAQAHQAVKYYEIDSLHRPVAQEVLAQIQAHFGDLDAAMAALPDLLKVPAGTTIGDLRFNPLWDPLRKDHRFQKFVAESAK